MDMRLPERTVLGYDPIFYLPEYGCTSAQLAPEKKNELSHRGEGLRRCGKYWRTDRAAWTDSNREE